MISVAAKNLCPVNNLFQYTFIYVYIHMYIFIYTFKWAHSCTFTLSMPTTVFCSSCKFPTKCFDGSFPHSPLLHQQLLRQMTNPFGLAPLDNFGSNTEIISFGHSFWHPALNPQPSTPVLLLLGASRTVVPTECQQAVCKGCFPQQPYGHTEAGGRQCCLL